MGYRQLSQQVPSRDPYWVIIHRMRLPRRTWLEDRPVVEDAALIAEVTAVARTGLQVKAVGLDHGSPCPFSQGCQDHPQESTVTASEETSHACGWRCRQQTPV